MCIYIYIFIDIIICIYIYIFIMIPKNADNLGPSTELSEVATDEFWLPEKLEETDGSIKSILGSVFCGRCRKSSISDLLSKL